jgi:chaperonin cofactor prefoldin
MNKSKEISEFIQSLSKDLENLPLYIKTLKSTNNLDLVQTLYLDSSFNTIYRQLHHLISKFERLHKSPNPDPKIYNTLRKEFFSLTQSITSFYNSSRVQIPTLPISRSEIPKSPKGILKPEPCSPSSITSDLTSLVQSLKSHSHTTLESRISTLESSTSSLKHKSIFLSAECSDNLSKSKSLLKRLKNLE